MKLKERVAILSIAACVCLMLIRYHRRTLNNLDNLTATDLDQDSNWSDLANEHYHKKREVTRPLTTDMEIPFTVRPTMMTSLEVSQVNTPSSTEEHNKPLKYLNEIDVKGFHKPNLQLIRTEKRSINLLNNVHGIAAKKAVGQPSSNFTESRSARSLIMDPWDTWHTMLDSRHVTQPDAVKLRHILKAMAEKRIIHAGVGIKGTQLKATFTLEGGTPQRVVFKPMRYDRNQVIVGKPYDGYDRHNGEIAAYHLDRLLGFYRAPPVVGRRVNLVSEVKTVADKDLLNTFFHNEKADTCFYGVCFYCKPDDPACGRGEVMEGSITIWLPFGWELHKYRHPWQRTYSNRKAKWEVDDNYCKSVIKNRPYSRGPRLLDIMDTAIFDFLIGNADRHHYEAFREENDKGMVLHLDNGKSFGNPSHDEMTILAPVFQCCKLSLPVVYLDLSSLAVANLLLLLGSRRLRKSTFERLEEFGGNTKLKDSLGYRLRLSLMLDPVYPVLAEAQLHAVDRRLKKALDVVRKCVEINGKQNVLIDDGL